MHGLQVESARRSGRVARGSEKRSSYSRRDRGMVAEGLGIMFEESTGKQNHTVTLTPKIHSRVPWRAVKVEPLVGFRLRVRFLDGSEAEFRNAPVAALPAPSGCNVRFRAMSAAIRCVTFGV